jgi:deoxyhypusine synthase
MTANSEHGAPPSTVTDAVLVPSNEMPEGSQKVEELDFNKFAGRPITVDDLMSGMNNMGFQASSIGEAVRIINDMVRSFHSSFNPFKVSTSHLLS